MKTISYLILILIFILMKITAVHAQEWQKLNTEGQNYYKAGKYQQAITSFEEAKRQVEKEVGKEHKNYASVLNNLAYTHLELRNYTQTETYFVEALSIYKKILPENSLLLTNSLNGLGDFYVQQSNYAKAETLLVECLTLRKKYLSADNAGYGLSLNKLGILYEKMGKYTQAEDLFKQFLAFTEKNPEINPQNKAAALNNLASVYESQAKYTQAEPLYFQSLEIVRKLSGENHENYASALNNLAFLYMKQGNYTKSETLFLNAKTIRAKVLGEKHPEYASTLNNLALLYSEMSNNVKAEALYLQALGILEKSIGKNHPYYASTLNNLAGIYIQQGNYVKAEVFLIESIEIKKKILSNTHPDYAMALNELGKLYRMQGNYPLGITESQLSLDIIKQTLGENHPYYAIVLNNLALLYQISSNYVKAETYFKEALTITEKNVGKQHADYGVSLNNLGSLYKSKGDFVKATPLFLEALAIFKKALGSTHAYNIETLHNLGVVYDAQANNTKASTYYQQASTLLIQEIENNLANLSEKEKSLFLNTVAYRFERYNSFVLRAYKTTPTLTAWAYNNTLATKGLIFASTQKIKERIQNSNDVALKSLYEEWKNKKTEYSKALQLNVEERKKKNISAEKLQIEANELEKQLSLKSEIFAKDNDNALYTWKDVQKSLKKDEVIVEIIRTQYKAGKQTDSTLYMALIITPTTQNQPEIVILSNGKELETDAVAYYKNNIKFKKEDKVSYDAFWADIKAKLGNAKNVYFVPDGVYHQINLLTLQNPTTKAYLKAETQIQLLSSSKDLIKYTQNTRKQLKNFKDYQVHLFGYPNYAQKNNKISTTKEERSLSFSAKMDTTQRFFNPNSGTITTLEGTKVEVNNISKILTNKNIKVTNYLENQAEEGTIKALKNPDILHIATHGFFLGDTEDLNKENADKFRENPLLKSGLLLKDAEKGMRGEILEGEDGVLTAQEALNLNLDDTQLVVMSACETGLGEIKNGEGVYGLQRSFQQAGAKTILMSLWKVDDTATQELMTLFYGGLVEGKTKRQAFNNAQEILYKKYKNPYFWGAFVMVGE